MDLLHSKDEPEKILQCVKINSLTDKTQAMHTLLDSCILGKISSKCKDTLGIVSHIFLSHLKTIVIISQTNEPETK